MLASHYQPAPHLPHLDATKLLPLLYQGSLPPSAEAVRLNGFDVLVFCAKEVQPPAHALQVRGLKVLRCGIDDNGHDLPTDDEKLVQRTAREVEMRMSAGQKILVTCAQGRNRSGLVNALVIHRAMRGTKSGADVVRYIQSRRPNALTNEAFVRAIRRLR